MKQEEQAMSEFLKQILANQFNASLCMLNQCVQACADEHWEGRIANDTFRQVTYHTLFFTDFYLSPSEDAFLRRGLHQRGGDELGPAPSHGLSKEETLTYLSICKQKAVDALAAETEASFEAPARFSRRHFSRAELHLYNIRHIQHHAAQCSAYLWRVDETLKNPKALPWVGSGWK